MAYADRAIGINLEQMLDQIIGGLQLLSWSISEIAGEFHSPMQSHDKKPFPICNVLPFRKVVEIRGKHNEQFFLDGHKIECDDNIVSYCY